MLTNGTLLYSVTENINIYKKKKLPVKCTFYLTGLQVNVVFFYSNSNIFKYFKRFKVLFARLYFKLLK